MATRADWQTKENDTAWTNQRNTFRNDWRNAVSGNNRRDERSEAVSSRQSREQYQNREFEDMEPAFRYGHAASQNFGDRHPRWNDTLGSELRNDYEGNWEQDAPLIRYAYEYDRAQA